MKAIVLIAASLFLFSCGSKTDGNTKLEGKMPPKEEGAIKIDAKLLASTTDLVCDMPVTSSIGDTATYQGKLYGFCGTGCKEDFLKEPAKYIK